MRRKQQNSIIPQVITFTLFILSLVGFLALEIGIIPFDYESTLLLIITPSLIVSSILLIFFIGWQGFGELLQLVEGLFYLGCFLVFLVWIHYGLYQFFIYAYHEFVNLFQ